MPRPKKPGAPEPKTRSRNGCWPCKNRKIKCGEEKPQCQNCERASEACDYSIRLNWDGRSGKRKAGTTPERSFIVNAPLEAPQTVSSGRNGSHAVSPPQRPSLLHSESQGSNRSLESIDEYKRKLQFNPSEPLEQFLQDGTKPSVIDPALTEPQHNAFAYQDLSAMPRSPGRGHVGAQNEANLGTRDILSTARIPSIRDVANAGYPSPNSNLDSPLAQTVSMPTGSANHVRHSSHNQMPPPFQGPFSSYQPYSAPHRPTDDTAFTEHARKRMRLSPAYDTTEVHQPFSSPKYGHFSNGGSSLNSMQLPTQVTNTATSPFSNHVGIPPTPAASSVTSDDAHHRPGKMSFIPQESPDLRRLSVKSLLSDDSPADSGNETPYMASTVTTPTMDYGVDRGFRDWDIPRNNDSAALDGLSPLLSRLDSGHADHDNKDGEHLLPEFGFGLYGNNSAHDQGGYYAQPVTVTIPRELTPLPPILQNNPMNLLYFHHFLNHTARILVPHDCAANPFKNILPQMALRDINLLHLLLAYSASHRALLLKHPEPSNRIATWVKDVFPSLRHALEDPNHQISNSNLATAIMLASLEIISPNAFEVTVPWQTHLTVARRMILARGGPESIHRKDKVSYFLSRWFAYLDVLGSLSGGMSKANDSLFSNDNSNPSSSGIYWATSDPDDDEDSDFQIDCLLGFTSRCVGILARIAELARQCDNERIDSESGEVREDWQPDAETVRKAERLKHDLQEARMHHYRGCPHRPSTPIARRHRRTPSHNSNHESTTTTTREEEAGYALLEMVAVNESFHWAGLVHLNRRILGKKSRDVEVQIA
ncbi:MAG: hypothetical protein Q9174_006298, partial [Haloplaca sp. 1 TL-2023]